MSATANEKQSGQASWLASPLSDGREPRSQQQQKGLRSSGHQLGTLVEVVAEGKTNTYEYPNTVTTSPIAGSETHTPIKDEAILML